MRCRWRSRRSRPAGPGRRSRPRWDEPSSRAPRRSPARRSGSGPRGRSVSVWSDAIALRVWVRWSKTRTRSVSMNAAIGTPTGSRSGSGHARLEGVDRVVGQGADGAAGEARHAFGRQDPAARDEPADRVEGIGRLGRVDRQVRAVGVDRHRPRLGPGHAVADLEQPPRPDAEERVAAQPLATLDGFEQVGRRRAVVEPEERPDRRLEVGRAGGAQQQRVRVGGQTLRLGQAERIGGAHRVVASGGSSRPRIKKRPVRPGTKGRAFRGATLIRRCRTP